MWLQFPSFLPPMDITIPLTLEANCIYNDEELMKILAKHSYICLEYLRRLICNGGKI